MLVSTAASHFTVRNTFVHLEALNKAPAARRSLSQPCSRSSQLATEWFFDDGNGKDTSSDDGSTVASFGASSLTASVADRNDLEGVQEEEQTICEKASLSECDFRACLSEWDFRAYAGLSSRVEFRKAVKRDAFIPNAVLDRLWCLVWNLESACQPGKQKQEESRVLQLAIELAHGSHVQQAVHGLVAMAECNDIRWLFQSFYTNYIIQKLCTFAAASDLQFLASALSPLARDLAQDRVACRILQRIFEHCSWKQLGTLPGKLLAGNFNYLCQSEFAGTVVTAALQHHPQFCRLAMDRIAASVAKNKNGTYVYEALIKYSPMDLLDLAFERLAQVGLPGLLLSLEGVQSLKALADRGLDERRADGLRDSIKEQNRSKKYLDERLADGLRDSIEVKHRSKPYAADLIKTLQI